MKKILVVLRKILVSGLVLYAYNMVAVSFGSIIPINGITLGSITILGFPALFALIFIQKIMF